MTALQTFLTTSGAVVLIAATPPTTASALSQHPTAAVRAPEATRSLEDRVRYRLETDAATRKYDIDVDVEGGVVTLSGDVASARQKARAVELARVAGVTRVDDRLEVDPDADKTLADRTKRGLNKAGDAIDDTWITTKVKWFFMGEDLLDGSDIDVTTKNNRVTLTGHVKSEQARARARQLAETTEGVRDVQDQLVVSGAR